MVGVTGAADAQAVVANYHVGGIFIGSWTDLSMLRQPGRDHARRDASAGRQRRRGGRPGVAAVVADRGRSFGARLAASSTPDEVYAHALARGQAMRGLGITVDFAPVVDVTDQPDDTVIGDRSFSDRPGQGHGVRRGICPRPARRRPAAGAQALPRPWPRVRRLAHHLGGDAAAGRSCRTNDLVPYRTLINERRSP